MGHMLHLILYKYSMFLVGTLTLYHYFELVHAIVFVACLQGKSIKRDIQYHKLGSVLNPTFY